MGKSKTHEEFIKELNLINPNILILDMYVKAKIKVKCQCLICNNKWDATPDNLLSGKGCKKCHNNYLSNLKRKSHENFINEINIINPNIDILGEYTTTNNKIKCKCKICNHIWEPYSSSLLSKHGCPNCARIQLSKLLSKSNKEFEDELYLLHGDEYSALEEYKGIDTPILIKHNICDTTWKVNPYSILNEKSHCPKCSTRTMKTTEKFKREVFDLVGDEYEVIGEYCGANSKIKMRHNKCGRIFEPFASGFLNGIRCICNHQFRGETKINKILENKMLYFIPQYKINNCKNKLPLPFDFAVFSDEEKLNIMFLCEYDGIGHYELVRFNGCSIEKAEKTFNNTKHNDNIKNKYCKQNNIPLLRIPYWEFDNIEQIIKDFINPLNKYKIAI